MQWYAARQRVEVDSERLEVADAVRAQPVVQVEPRRREAIAVHRVAIEPAVAAGDQLALEHRRHQLGAEDSREVVIAGAGKADGLRAGPLTERAHGRRGRQPRQRLEQVRDLGAGEPKVAMAAVALDAQQTALDELCEMRTRGRSRDPSLVGEHRCR